MSRINTALTPTAHAILKDTCLHLDKDLQVATEEAVIDYAAKHADEVRRVKRQRSQARRRLLKSA